MSASQTSLDFDRYFGGTPAQPSMPAENYLPPRSRSTDAPSSHRAEAEMNRSGKMRGQRMIALTLVEKHPGSTAEELSRYHTLDPTEQFKTKIWLRKRLPELRELKLARTTQTGNEDFRWWPNGTGLNR